MIELERHIEILLLDNDCVIVPGLGGFVAHHVDARFDSRDNMFLPPMRTLGFNPKLDMNDSLLAQSYVEAYDISYPEALSRIDAEVDELRQTLERDGFYELSDIGVLSINAEGKYEFEPCESGILTPELYGLSGFQMPHLAEEAESQSETIEMPLAHAGNAQQKTGAAERTEQVSVQDEGAKVLPFGESKLAAHLSGGDSGVERTISIKVSVLRNIVAVACAIVAFFVMTTPITTDVYENGQKMSGINYSLLYNLVPRDGYSPTHTVHIYNKVKPVVKQQPARVEPAKASVTHDARASVNQVQNSAATVAAAPQQEAKDYYGIVLACRITKANAEAFVKKLHTDGYAEAHVVGGDGTPVKVVYGEYSSEKEACGKLNVLRDKDLFRESWIYHVK